MPTTTMTTSPCMKHSKLLIAGAAGFRPRLLARFARAVETSDWDEHFLRQEKWLNGVCLAVVVFAALYLGPILLARLTG